MVSLILAVVIFGMGMIFFSDVFQEASDIKARLDSQTDKQIRDILLSTGEKVAIPFDKVEANAEQVATFGVGIFNVPIAGAPERFYVQYLGCDCYDGSDSCTLDGTGEFLTFPSDSLQGFGEDFPINVAPNQQRVAVIGIRTRDRQSNPEGSNIICTLQVKDAATHKPYGSKQQVYIQV